VFRGEGPEFSIDPHEVVRIILDAHEFYSERKIDERYESMALDLVRRYVCHEGLPRENDALFGAALYVVSRHPWSHPNPMTKGEFAAKLSMKDSSLDWFADSIVDRLGYLAIHDKARQKFFVDPQGIVASVLESVVRGSVGEEVVRGVVSGAPLSSTELSEKIVDRLCNVVKIVPLAFEEDLTNVVQRMIEVESKRLTKELGPATART
jgi:hypothetical protein